MAIRCSILNPHFDDSAPQSTEGIVLIDEIDLHLHPKWQRQLVPKLLSIFPKVQFVATTHSPFVIQSMYGQRQSQVWDIWAAQAIALNSKSIEDIAEENQHVEIPQQSHRFLQMKRAAEEYFILLRACPRCRI